MRTTSLDHMFLTVCFWLMSSGLRLIQLGNRLTKEN